MMTQNNDTITNSIAYYDQNAKSYFDRTVVIDLKPLYERFTQFLHPEATILDAGSGSGRDTKYFLESGYSVTSMDASFEMTKISSAYTGQKTLHLTFEQMQFSEAFDAIWCSASLVHTPPDHMHGVLKNIARALKNDGIWFLSFMHGVAKEIRQGQYFHHLTEEKLRRYIEAVGNLEIIDLCITKSFEKERECDWIQCIIKKTACTFCLPELNKAFGRMIAETSHYYIVEDNFPVRPGHLLLISKAHAHNWFEADEETQKNLVPALDIAKRWQQKTYQSEGYNVGFNCGSSSGQTVPHLHIHVIPRHHGDAPNPEGGVRGVIPHKQKYKL